MKNKKGNSGDWNSGNMNSGNGNSGNGNSGDWNSGNGNSGNGNSGDWNSGNMSSGNGNSGNGNSGDWNSGIWNSGNGNSGDWNSGNDNSGDWNSGHWNSGHWNSGDWNSGNRNSGFFNVDEPKIRIFGKETNMKREDIDFPEWLYFSLNKWISAENMTKTEKEENPEYKTIGGYLKKYKYKDAWRKAFENAKINDLRKTLKLPNFNYEIFEKITGISKKDFDRKLLKKEESESGTNKGIDKVESFKELDKMLNKLYETEGLERTIKIMADLENIIQEYEKETLKNLGFVEKRYLKLKKKLFENKEKGKKGD